MRDLSQIPLSELENDLAEARLSVLTVRRLAAAGATRIYSLSPAQVITNEEVVISVIEAELQLRKEANE